jgi:DNA-binding XRE family transcriptional regulator
MKYPNTLKEHRLKANLKQKEVATLLGFKSEDRISHWEKGQSLPSVINLIKICRVYRVKIEEVYKKI